METLSLDDADKARVNEALGQCALFRALKPEHLPQLVKAAEVLQYSDGETVITAGRALRLVLRAGGRRGRRPHRDAQRRRRRGARPRAPPGQRGRGRPAAGRAAHGLGRGRAATSRVLKFGAKAFEAMFQKIPELRRAPLRRAWPTGCSQLSGACRSPTTTRARAALAARCWTCCPWSFCQRHRVLPLELDGNVLTLGLVDDPTPQVIAAVREHVPSMELHPVHIDVDVLQRGHAAGGGRAAGWRAKGGGRGRPPARRPAAPPRLDKLLERMVAEGASDLHLSAGHKPALARRRRHAGASTTPPSWAATRCWSCWSP